MKCSKCGKRMKKTRGMYRYRECGLDNVYLKDVTMYRCPEGHQEPVIPKPALLDEWIARNLMKKAGVVAGAEIRFLRKQMHLNSTQLAALMGVTLTTVSRWENDDAPIGAEGDRLLRLLYVRHLETTKNRVVYKNLADVLARKTLLPRSKVIDIRPADLRGVSYSSL